MEVNIDWLDKSFQIPNTLLYQSISEKIETLEGNRQTEFLLSNPISIPILYFINRNKENISISDLEIFAQRVEKSYQNTFYFKSIASYISAKKRKPIRIGDKVEDFKLTDKDGNQVSVINANEKTKLITIFSSGCFYSISSISLLEQLKKVNDNKIEIISIWADETKDAWLNAYIDQKNKITWTNVWDEYGFASTYFNNTGWPTFYVINAEGSLMDIFHNYSQKTANKLKDLTK
jgi:peroxiredoxin